MGWDPEAQLHQRSFLKQCHHLGWLQSQAGSWPRPLSGQGCPQSLGPAPLSPSHLVLLDQLLDALQVAPPVFQHRQWEAVLYPDLEGEQGQKQGQAAENNMSHVASWHQGPQCGDSAASSTHQFSWLWGLHAVFSGCGGWKQAIQHLMDFCSWTSQSERSPAWPGAPDD